VQVRVLGVRDDHDDYAWRIVERLKGAGFRADMVEASEKLGSRIRKGKLEKLPYVLVVGDDDVEHGTVGVNRRGSDEPERGVTVDDFIDRLRAEVTARIAT
jgi:threonyl-tRNA synthetase